MGRAQNAMAAAMDARVSLAAGDMPSVSADDIVATIGETMLPLEAVICFVIAAWVSMLGIGMHGAAEHLADYATLAFMMAAVAFSTPLLKVSAYYRAAASSGLLLGCATVPVAVAAVMLRTRSRSEAVAFYLRLAVSCSLAFAFEAVYSDGRWGGGATEGGRRAARRNLMRPTLVALILGATLAARFPWLPMLLPAGALLAGQGVTRALLRGVRGSFTIAEATIVSSAIVLFLIDTGATAAGMLSKKLRTPLARRMDKAAPLPTLWSGPVDVAVQCVLAGTVVVAFALWPFVASALREEAEKKEDAEKHDDGGVAAGADGAGGGAEKCAECGGQVSAGGAGACSCIGRGVSAARAARRSSAFWRDNGFLAALAVLVGLVCMPAASLLLKKHFLLWVFDHLTAEPQRLHLLAYWGGVLALVLGTYPPSNTALPRTIVRKGYHLVSLALFLPAQLMQPETLRLSYAVAFALMVTLELVRAARVGPLARLLRRGMLSVVDERDSGVLVLTHIYLLLGCAAPAWLTQGGPLRSGLRPLFPFAGVLAVGVGDTAAAVFGTYFGRTPWAKPEEGGPDDSPGSGKTVEGTAAGAVATFLASAVVLFLATPGDGAMGVLLSLPGLALLGACAALALLEAFTDQVDNLVLPVWFWAALVAAARA